MTCIPEQTVVVPQYFESCFILIIDGKLESETLSSESLVLIKQFVLLIFYLIGSAQTVHLVEGRHLLKQERQHLCLFEANGQQAGIPLLEL